jgi:replicative DNA helicase
VERFAQNDYLTNLKVDDNPHIRVIDVRTRARRNPTDLIVIDYLQLLTPPRAESRQVQVSEMSRGLKLLSRELDVAVLCLAQVNRAPEARSDKRPSLADLRESGAIENDSDQVILLSRAEKEPNLVQVNVAKHRNGPVGKVDLLYQPEYCRFVTPAMTEHGPL